jgi:hypothetical protein
MSASTALHIATPRASKASKDFKVDPDTDPDSASQNNAHLYPQPWWFLTLVVLLVAKRFRAPFSFHAVNFFMAIYICEISNMNSLSIGDIKDISD